MNAPTLPSRNLPGPEWQKAWGTFPSQHGCSKDEADVDLCLHRHGFEVHDAAYKWFVGHVLVVDHRTDRSACDAQHPELDTRNVDLLREWCKRQGRRRVTCEEKHDTEGKGYWTQVEMIGCKNKDSLTLVLRMPTSHEDR